MVSIRCLQYSSTGQPDMRRLYWNAQKKTVRKPIGFQTVFCTLLRVSGTVQIYARYHYAACAGQNLVDDSQRHEPYGDCRKYQHADNQI